MADYDIQDYQIECLVLDGDDGRAFTADAFGEMVELGPKGRIEFRRIWDEEPHRRPLFGDGEPPLEWRTGEPTP